MRYIKTYLLGKYHLIPESLKSEFNHEHHLTNYNRAFLLNTILLVISFILLILDFFNAQQGLWLRNYGYKLLYFMHFTLVLGLLLLFLLRFSIVYYLKAKSLPRFYNYYALATVIFLLFICAGTSVVDQTIHGQATVFILGLLVLSVSIYFIPLHSMLIYSASLLIFIIGITYYQPNPDVLQGHYINGPLVFILSLMISIVFYNQRVEEFLNKKTILFQKNELENKTKELEETMSALLNTQKQLVQSEKLAALGNLVAGIAHEVNTPVGVALTASTHLNKLTSDVVVLFNNNELKKSNLTEFLDNIKEGSHILESNLRRASDLVRSFKQVAVDQSHQSIRRFNVKDYLDEILLSLQPKTKYFKHQIIVNCPDNIVLNSYPGVMSQIITNLLMNAYTHAFDKNHEGTITINIEKEGNKLILIFSDNGKGISEQYIDKIYEPFFTTNRGDGGTGLGLHVVYNLVTQILKGTISVTSTLNKGTDFSLEFPLNEGDLYDIAISR